MCINLIDIYIDIDDKANLMKFISIYQMRQLSNETDSMILSISWPSVKCLHQKKNRMYTARRNSKFAFSFEQLMYIDIHFNSLCTPKWFQKDFKVRTISGIIACQIPN